MLVADANDTQELQKADSVSNPPVRQASNGLTNHTSVSSPADGKSTAIRGASFDWSTIRVSVSIKIQFCHFINPQASG